MRLIRSRAMGGVMFLAVLILMAGTVGGKDGRDFAGYYSLADADERDGEVQVTLVLQLFNHSGGDLKQAVVLVRPSRPSPVILASLAPIPQWPHGRDVVVSQRVTISREEYQRWGARTQPGLFVVYIDEAGQEWRRPAQLSRRPTIPESTRPPGSRTAAGQ